MSRHKRLKQPITSPWRQARRQRARKARDAHWDARYGEGGWLRPGVTQVRNDGPAEPVRRV